MRAWIPMSFVALLGGCAGVGKGTEAGQPWAATDPGSGVCRQAVEALRDQVVRDVMCATLAPKDAVELLEPRLDPVLAAGVVASCAATRCAPGHADLQWRWVAFAWDLSMRVEPDAVAAGLEDSALPRATVERFVARYRAARDRLRAIVAERDDRWRDVMIKPVLEARAERAAADEALAPWREQVAGFVAEADTAIAAGKPAASWVDKASALRRDYVAACKTQRDSAWICLGDGEGRALTAVIDRVAEARGDRALRAAESELAWISDHSDPRADEAVAARAAFEIELHHRATWLALIERGAAEAAALRFPTPPIDVGELGMIYDAWWYPELRPAPFFAQEAGESVVEIEKHVRAVKRRGKRATILWRKEGYESSYETGCTGRQKISSISESGNINYREHCTGPEQEEFVDLTEEPVDVPWEEAAAIAPGEHVVVYVDKKTRRGHVAVVRAPWTDDIRYPDAPARRQLREFRKE